VSLVLMLSAMKDGSRRLADDASRVCCQAERGGRTVASGRRPEVHSANRRALHTLKSIHAVWAARATLNHALLGRALVPW